MSLESSTIQPYEVTDVFKERNKLYLKVWLLDDSKNQLGWQVDGEALRRHINTALGKPAILNSVHFHPLEFNHIKSASIDDYLKAQEPYKIGSITNVFPGKLPNNYAALIEITDKRIVDAYNNGTLKIPKYVSPSIFEAIPSGDGEPVKNFEFLHVAFVDEPAFGVNKANVSQPCLGTEQTCMNHLKEASKQPCNVCPVTELSKFNNTINSSYLNSEPKIPYTTLESNTSQESKPVVEAQNAQPVTENKPVEQTKVEIVGTTPVENRAPIKVESQINTPVVEEKKDDASKVDNSEINTLKEQLSKLQSTIAELTAFKEEQVKVEKENKEKSKRELIEQYVTSDSCSGNEEERARRIAALMYIPDSDLKSFLETHYILPETVNSKVKQASARRITDFSKSEKLEESKIKQAGIMASESNTKAARVMQFINSSSSVGSRFS